MTDYKIVRSGERTFIFATECDKTSHIEINTALIDAEKVLQTMRENLVAPEHLENVYEDLLFKKFMV